MDEDPNAGMAQEKIMAEAEAKLQQKEEPQEREKEEGQEKQEGSEVAVSPPSPLSKNSSDVKDENADDQSSGTDNEADAKEQLYQEAQQNEFSKNGDRLQIEAVKKSGSDDDLLTLEDRVKASPKNFQIAQPAESQFKDPLEGQMMQESQIVNPLFTQPSAVGDKDEDDDEDYDIFADSESKTNTITGELGSKSEAVDNAPSLAKNTPFASANMSQVFNPMAQSQQLDQSAVAQSNIMEQSSIMNQSVNQPQNQPQEESILTQPDQSRRESELSGSAMMKLQEYYDTIEQLERFTREGKFNQSVAVIQEHLLKFNSMLEGDQKSLQMNVVDSEMNMLLNELLIFNYIKLKEFQNARSMALDCIKKLSKSGMFEVSSSRPSNTSAAEAESVPFGLKFMNALSIYSASNSRNKKNALIELYELQRTYNFERDEASHVNAMPMKEDGLLALIRREKEELFGLFPPKNDRRSKYIMVSLEIARIHHRAQDYRNAYTVLTRLNEKCPGNPMIISKLGRFCLEIGRKLEAISHFSVIQDMISRKRAHAQQEKDARSQVGNVPQDNQAESTDLIDDLLQGRAASEASVPSVPPDKETQNLIVLNLINQGFVCIFDANYDEAIKYFRQVLTIKPANIVAANNLATCKIFLNKVGESIKTLEDLLKKDPQSKINDQVVTNLLSMYEIWFAHNTKEKKEVLNKFCVDNAKDSVAATITFQQQQSRMPAKKR